MRKKRIKYNLWLVFVLSTIAAIFYYKHITTTNHYSELSHIQKTFSQQQTKADQLLEDVQQQLADKKRQNTVQQPLMLHIYKNDSLIYWNTNQIPITLFTDINFPTNGINKIQNGWYYTKTRSQNNYTIASTFLIKREYIYENEYLNNDFASIFNTSIKADIIIDETKGFPIYGTNDTYLFSIQTHVHQPISTNQGGVLASFILLAIFAFSLSISVRLQQINSKWTFLFPILLLLIRALTLHYNTFDFLSKLEIYQASLYGTSYVFPNLFDYLLNVHLILVVVHFIQGKFSKIRFKKTTIGTFILIGLTYYSWIGFDYLLKGLIENSSIPLEIESIMGLNIYSLLAIYSIALLGLSFFLIAKTIVQTIKNYGTTLKEILVYNLILGCIFIAYHIGIWEISTPKIYLPFLFIILLSIMEYKDFRQKQLSLGMLLLTLYSLTISQSINFYNNRKDESEKALFASQLITERDISTELEFNKLQEKILGSKFIPKLITKERIIKEREFQEGIEKRHFIDFWDRYELTFHLFDEQGCDVFAEDDKPSVDSFDEFQQLIDNNAEQSEINPSIYFIMDYSKQYSYIIKQAIPTSKNTAGTLFVTLKSKKIPEEIGFPRLLLNAKTYNSKHLENYSIAKYHDNQLVSKYGSYDYPTSLKVLQREKKAQSTDFTSSNFQHTLVNTTSTNAVVISNNKKSIMDIATGFSYLFCFFGLLILPIYIRLYNKTSSIKKFTLSTKIQVALIAVVVITLIASGVGSGIFIRDQYAGYASQALKEKTHSIELDLKSRIGKNKELTVEQHSTSLNHTLTYLSKIYSTDINFYDKKGILIATSRPKIFNYGLLSEQINPVAKRQLLELKQSDYVHQENIGDLIYNSAYSPLYNNKGILLGYVNLQHFGQQEEVAQQIQHFLESVINIFVLLLAFSAITAIFIANWITSPFLVIQERFSKLNLGKTNQRIEYNMNDEIGALVNSYNQKIEELEVAAQQLALSERESAWRDMAKQIAHEIKNPLTPMKLSVQHLMRSFDPEDPNASLKINKVSQSLIEQINVLTNIANEFSNFAKMPQPVIEKVDLVAVIKNASELFEQGVEHYHQVEIITNLPDQAIIRADKEQMLRVFNNLIKNAIQATSANESGKVTILMENTPSTFLITVKDNGIGMSTEQQAKIFTPYFTTKSTGTGIGLSMVKQIVLNHHGTISFQSTEGIGTSFTIELPKEL